MNRKIELENIIVNSLDLFHEKNWLKSFLVQRPERREAFDCYYAELKSMTQGDIVPDDALDLLEAHLFWRPTGAWEMYDGIERNGMRQLLERTRLKLMSICEAELCVTSDMAEAPAGV